MSIWEVKDYLSELTDISAYKEEEILSLCRSCVKEIDSRLKNDADRSDYRVIAAAAGLAYYKLTLKKISADSGESITDFKAGDVSIKQESKSYEKLLANAESFCNKKMTELIPLCRDNSFAFNQIQVM